MDKSIEQALQNFGLNTKEIKFYLSSLYLGEANMSDIAKRSGIKRSGCYLLFKSLQNKGLIGSVKTRRGLLYSAASPESLLEKARAHVDRINMILPKLRAATKKQDSKPKISYYEGINAYHLALDESLKNPNITLRHIGSLSEMHKMMTEEYDLKHYVPRRLEQNIFLKALYLPEIKVLLDTLNDEKELREVRYLPANHTFKTATLIYENTVVISSSQEELITVVIESEEIAKSEAAKFDMIWDLIGSTK